MSYSDHRALEERRSKRRHFDGNQDVDAVHHDHDRYHSSRSRKSGTGFSRHVRSRVSPRDPSEDDSRSSRFPTRHRRKSRSRSSSVERRRSRRSPSCSPRGATDFRDNCSSTSTLMLRGLPLNMSEQEIRGELMTFGYSITELRLVRRRDTGASRGFGFLEFSSVEEAQRFMADTKGYILLMNEYPITLMFSASRWSSVHSNAMSGSGDERKVGERPESGISREWDCVKCSIRNFKRRDTCFKCGMLRSESDNIRNLDGFEMTSNIPSDTLVVMGLTVDVQAHYRRGVDSAISDTSSIIEAFSEFTNIPIRNSYLVRDATTGLSRCFALLDFNSVSSCMSVYQAYCTMRTPIYMGPQSIVVNYCKCSFMSAVYELSDPNGKSEHFPHNHPSRSTAMLTTNTCSQLPEAQADRANVAASVAHQALQNLHQTRRKDNEIASIATCAFTNNLADQCATQAAGYQFDVTSGYYYSPSTGMYFDPKTQIFYNPQLQQYMYWNPQANQYVYASQMPIPVETSVKSDVQPHESSSTAETSLIEPKLSATAPTEILDVKERNAEISKKISIDMARWAENMNRRKATLAKKPLFAKESCQKDGPDNTLPTAALSKSSTNPASVMAKAAAAHAASYAVLPSRPKRNQDLTLPLVSAAASCPVNTNKGDDDPDPQHNSSLQSPTIIDWNRLVCMLCKRQFDSKTILEKHIDKSKLHKENLEKLNGQGA
ncbi:hypothetical protein ACOME3_009904 [Neoechinorhynchus agilis]